MAFWLFAQIPQVLENYRNSSVDGIAFGFLAFWIFGDVSNLLGCLLTDALPFQVLLSSYYCFIDIILISQYLYYTRVYPKIYQFKTTERMEFMNETSDQDQDELPAEHITRILSNIASAFNNSTNNSKFTSRNKNSRNTTNFGTHLSIPQNTAIPNRRPSTSSSFTNLVTASFITSFTKVNGHPLTNDMSTSSPSLMSFLLVNSKIIGVFFAWTCTFSYLVARIPQLLKNYKRKSSEGISILLFICALNGNLFYTISILTSSELLEAPTPQLKYEFIIKELPYILGSAGTVLFDIFALFQFYLYNHWSKSNDTSKDHQQLRIGGIDDSLQNGDYLSSPINGATYNLIMANRHPHEFIQKLNQQDNENQQRPTAENHSLQKIHTRNDEGVIDSQSALLEHASVNSYSSSTNDDNNDKNYYSHSNNVELFETAPENFTINHLKNNNSGEKGFLSSGNNFSNSLNNTNDYNNSNLKYSSFSAVGSLKELISNYDVNKYDKFLTRESSEKSIHNNLGSTVSSSDNNNHLAGSGASSSLIHQNPQASGDDKTKKKYKSKISMVFRDGKRSSFIATDNDADNLKIDKNNSNISVQQSAMANSITTNEMSDGIIYGTGNSNSTSSPLTPWDVLALQENNNNFATVVKS